MGPSNAVALTFTNTTKTASQKPSQQSGIPMLAVQGISIKPLLAPFKILSSATSKKLKAKKSPIARAPLNQIKITSDRIYLHS
jgi:hypothetical protein